ncbi:hypothetical protein M0R45_016481 [Rubus argutus]|uniref:EF-hand domain-containing protein n=1 Tax=Rubus argutus TaxID=59490 RepID=A0AAW1XV62_RUBAR
MDRNGMRESLLPGLMDPSPQTNTKNGPKRRKFCRTRSAPLAEYAPLEANGIRSVQPSESIINPSFRRVAIFLTVYLGLGTICFYLVRHQIEGEKTNAILDAVYFCVVTMTTLGYGDLVPDSTLAKLLACAFVFTGMALVGLILSQAADYLVQKQETLIVKALHVHQKFGPTEVLKEVEVNSVRYKCVTVFILLFVLITSGTIFLATVEKLDLVDAFYCVCSTITTLGSVFLYMAELNTQNRQRALVKFVLTRATTNVDLEAADLDGDGVVGAAEFIIYKLKEMGKITQEDIRLVMEEFEALDVDQSGTLSVSDLTLAQSSQT